MESLRVPKLLSQFLQDGLHFSEDEKHFSAKRRFEKKFFVQNAIQDERSGHAPVAKSLPQPIVLLRTGGLGDLQEFVSALRKKFGTPPMPGLPHFCFAA